MVPRSAGSGPGHLQHRRPAAPHRSAGRARLRPGAGRAGRAARDPPHPAGQPERDPAAGHRPADHRQPGRHRSDRTRRRRARSRAAAAVERGGGAAVRPRPGTVAADPTGEAGRGQPLPADRRPSLGLRRLVVRRARPRTAGAVRRRPCRHRHLAARAADPVRRLRALGARTPAGHRAGGAGRVLAAGPGRRPQSAAADRSPAPGRADLRGWGRGGHPGPGAARSAESAQPHRRHHPVRHPPGRFPGAAAPLQRAGRRRGRHGERQPHPHRTGPADRLPGQHAGDPLGPVRRPQLRGPAGAGEGGHPGGVRPPGAALRQAGRGAEGAS